MHKCFGEKVGDCQRTIRYIPENFNAIPEEYRIRIMQHIADRYEKGLSHGRKRIAELSFGIPKPEQDKPGIIQWARIIVHVVFEDMPHAKVHSPFKEEMIWTPESSVTTVS